MQQADKVLLGIMVPVIVGVIIAAIVLATTVHACPAGETWDKNKKACRPKCPGEGKKHGQKYDADSQTCSCPTTAAPVWSSASQQCVGVCAVGETWNPAKQSCDPGTVDTCTPLPAVDPVTGAVSNTNHFAEANNTCREGTQKELTALCQAAACQLPTVCAPGDTWDGYDKATSSCTKTKGCADQPCDAAYCTSESVRSLVGSVNKMWSNNGCVNPSPDQVGALCDAVPQRAWVSPNCLSTATGDLHVSVNNASVEKGMEGTVTQTLINGTLDLNAQGTLNYFYSISGNELTTALTGVPSDVTPCPSAPDCFRFVIRDLPSNLLPGTYSLQMVAYPGWSDQHAMYRTPAPVSVDIMSGENPADTLAQVKLSASLAQQVCANPTVVQGNLSVLESRFPSTVNPAATALQPNAPASEEAPVLVDCAASFCQLNEQVVYKLVVLAWAADVASTQPCPLSDTFIKFELKREDVKTGEIKVLIGPTPGKNQPSMEERQGKVISFFDLVPVNSTVKYTLAAYLAPSLESALQYDFATCRSPRSSYTLTVPGYTPAACHALPVPGEFPPYMVSDGGICKVEKSQTSRDFYCLFGSQQFDANHVALFEDNKCRNIQHMYPDVTGNTWDSTCFTKYDARSCRNGTAQSMEVSCKPHVLLDGSPTPFLPEKVKDRLNAVVTDFKKYSWDPSQNASVLANPQAIFDHFHHCGPEESRTYATRVEECMGYDATTQKCADETCCTLAKSAAQCTNPNMVCGEWKREESTNTWTRGRTCFPTATGPNSACCNSVGYFELLPSGGGGFTGTCTCPRETAGDNCEHMPCKNYFGDKAYCSPDGQTPTGVCRATSATDFHCDCWPPALSRQPGETDASFGRRVWYEISGEWTENSGGHQAAIAAVKGIKDVMTCTQYSGLCNMALNIPYLKNRAIQFGCTQSCNTPYFNVAENREMNAELDCGYYRPSENDVNSHAYPPRNPFNPSAYPVIPSKCPPKIDVLEYRMKGLGEQRFGGPGHAETKYIVYQLGWFVAQHLFAFIPNTAGDVRLSIGDGKNKDRAKVKLFLAVGEVPSSWLTTNRPTNQMVFEYELQATRDHDAVFSMDRCNACLQPGEKYTLGIMLTFEKGVGTDDLVTLRTQDYIALFTTNTEEEIRRRHDTRTMCPILPIVPGVNVNQGMQGTVTTIPNSDCLVNPYTCKCPDVPEDKKMCRRNTFKTPVVRNFPNAAILNIDPVTGCSLNYNDGGNCSQHVPTAQQPYKYKNPQANDFRCGTCSLSGSCRQQQDELKNWELCKWCTKELPTFNDEFCTTHATTTGPDDYRKAFNDAYRQSCSDLYYSISAYPTNYSPSMCNFYCNK